jgi:hypothetical protein
MSAVAPYKYAGTGRRRVKAKKVVVIWVNNLYIGLATESGLMALDFLLDIPAFTLFEWNDDQVLPFIEHDDIMPGS